MLPTIQPFDDIRSDALSLFKMEHQDRQVAYNAILRRVL